MSLTNHLLIVRKGFSIKLGTVLIQLRNGERQTSVKPMLKVANSYQIKNRKHQFDVSG